MFQRYLKCILGSLVCIGMLSSSATAQIDVFLDFTTDGHNGTGGGANAVSDWIDELNQATAAAGVANFSAGERSTIESNIEAQLNSMYANYNVNFTTTAPGGSHDTIYFGVEAGAGLLGFAPLDIGNMFSDQTTNVAPEAFSFFIEPGESRASQISEISLGLAGTAAHELGHAVGLLHHHAYSNQGITPANYGATGGLQNNHIIATGSTGLSEVGRETLRDFSPFSQVMLDITGGAAMTFAGQDNDSLVTGGVTSDFSENGSFSTLGTDAGATIGTAQTMTLTEGPSSEQLIGFIEADLDSAGNTDVDVFRFTTESAGVLTAEAFSNSLLYGSGAEFDPMLELLDSTGTVMTFGSNDDVFYSGNLFNGGTFRSSDPFLVNIELPSAGDYYLRVSSVSGGEEGSNYWLVAGFASAVPEPGSLTVLVLAGLVVGTRRRRRKLL